MRKKPLLCDCLTEASEYLHTVGSIVLIKNSICMKESDCCVRGKWLHAFSSVYSHNGNKYEAPSF